MIPEIGNFALILALLLATAQAALPIIGAARGDRALMAVARPAARGQVTDEPWCSVFHHCTEK